MTVYIEKGLLKKWWIWNAQTGSRMKPFRHKPLAVAYCIIHGYEIVRK